MRGIARVLLLHLRARRWLNIGSNPAKLAARAANKAAKFTMPGSRTLRIQALRGWPGACMVNADG
jgi:hypothetical protein